MAKYWGDMVFSEPYKDKDGADKKSYHKFGKVFEGDNGNKSIYIPLLNKWFSLYPKREQGQISGNPAYGGSANYHSQEPPPPSEPPLPF